MPQAVQNARKDWFMSPFSGIDRLQLDPDPEYNRHPKARPLKNNWSDQNVRLAWARDWYRSLLGNSDFYLTGIYLNSKDADPKLVTSASRTDHKWTQNWAQFEQQGWGLWPLYQGFSDTTQEYVKIPKDWEATKVQRGIAAAKHIAAIVSSLPGDNTGMVVYIDNEYGPTKILMPYYKALFAELQATQPSGRLPLRAGLYIRAGNLNDVLSELPDLYIWLIETRDGDLPNVKGDKAYPNPIEPKQSSSSSNYQRFMSERYPIVLRKSLFLPVGRQCTLTGKTSGYTDSLIASVGEGIPGTVSQFDFNVSLVRDPRYPQADPRFASLGPSQIVYSSFEKSGVKTAEAGVQVIPMQKIEPEAPLVVVDQELYSIAQDGSIFMSVKREITHDPLQTISLWSTPSIVVPKGDLRRMRSFNVIRTSPTETLLFYLSNRNKIQAYKRVQKKSSDVDAQWAKSDTLGDLHPFTNLNVVLFKNKIYLFFMQVILGESTEASLCFIQWQGSAGQQISRALKESAIVAMASTNYLLVFFLGKDCQLSFTYAIEDPRSGDLKWSPVITTAALRTSIKLHPHTRIAACEMTPLLVKVAFMSSDGIPSVCDVLFIPGIPAWAFSSCKQYFRNENKRTLGSRGPAKGFVAAIGWTINLYGDIALIKDGQSTLLYCAGAAPDKRGILLRRLEEDEPWLRLVDPEHGLP
ncbi:uncharacterized protein KY384_003568 [Bacidia gigantensis]|uniref:uncharacterized protein n=1 Tax=Bacidia gigantensis TaxID=2732470 RepID=UPI001D054EC1|nr:uncharacterized protein KY384_003568 [Bacidia gigantensis]KAG8531932.1 hypothetical protein KY384_003568 [Bacidia gigantensis]